MSEAYLHSLLEAKPLANSALAEKASTYCQNYPPFARDEQWRWTPLKALKSLEHRLQSADYQLDLPDETVIMEDGEAVDVLNDPAAPFAALNLALNSDTLSLHIPEGSAPKEPLAVNVTALRRAGQFSRIHISVAAQAKVALWLDFSAETDSAQFPLITLDLADSAQCDGVLWFAGADDSQTVQLAYLHTAQQANSQLRINAMQSGSALARLDVVAELHEVQAEFAFGGVQIPSAERTCDYHITVRHLAGQCQSLQRIRGVVDDAGQGIFDGLIYVGKGAQGSDAKQDCRHILLSEQARAMGVPRLEIYADDVQCAHGATVGFLDPESLFYLRSRGIDKASAQMLLITSFLHEAVVVKHPAVSDALHEAITALWTGEDNA